MDASLNGSKNSQSDDHWKKQGMSRGWHREKEAIGALVSCNKRAT
jgi:hypothetical protein